MPLFILSITTISCRITEIIGSDSTVPGLNTAKIVSERVLSGGRVVFVMIRMDVTSG